MLTLRIKRLCDESKIPSYATLRAAGLDLYSMEDYSIRPGETHMFKTGIAMEIPEGYAGLIWDRSGLGSKEIHRFAGVVDDDYRGEVRVILHNNAKKKYDIKKGDRIAQMLIQEVEKVIIEDVDELSDTFRGEGGFGSSGD